HLTTTSLHYHLSLHVALPICCFLFGHQFNRRCLKSLCACFQYNLPAVFPGTYNNQTLTAMCFPRMRRKRRKVGLVTVIGSRNGTRSLNMETDGIVCVGNHPPGGVQDFHCHKREIHAIGGYHVTVGRQPELDRKSTRLNSSHVVISYAVFCLKKQK